MGMRDNPQVQRALQFVDALEKRDRVALVGLAAFFAVLFLYFGMWAPANEYLRDSLEYRNRQLSVLQYMRASEQHARDVAGSKRQTVMAGQSLLTQISRSARQHQIQPNRMQPEGSNAVSVWFDSVAFNDFIRWLEQLTVEQGIDIKQISIDREDEPGKVNARIVLGA